jgi:DNA primase
VPFFADHFVERVRAASDIVDVIGASLPLKRAGTNFVTLCPFHREKSPSFNVNPARQIFHCFGCHKGGDVFRFVQEYENIAFPEAIERLAERARIPLEYEAGSPGAIQARGAKDSLLKLHEAICQRWQHCLATEAGGQLAREYLEKRGVAAEAIKEFRIGAAPESWDDTVNWAKSKGFDTALCEQAGLIIRKEGSSRPYDRFRGRLMFPICDEQGRVIAFSGRVLQGDEKAAKYVNSPETPLFTKGRVLFALDKAKRAILEAGRVIICEGQLDTIACHAAGVRNVVAPQGTALTGEHARILKRYVDEVILCFDGDKAGRNAAIRSLDDLLASGLSIKIASIPPPEDPDSYIKKFGAEAFQKILAEAQGFFEFLLQNLITEHDVSSDRGRLAIVRIMGEALAKTGNSVLVDTHAQRTAQRLGVSAESVRAEFRKAGRAQTRMVENEAPTPVPANATDKPRPGSAELWLIKFLLQADQDLLAWATAHLDPNWIIHPTARAIVEARLHDTVHENPKDLTRLLATLASDSFACTLVTESANERRVIPNLGQQISETCRRVRDLWIDRQIALLSTQLSDPNWSDDQRLGALKHQQELRAWKRQPLTPLSES